MIHCLLPAIPQDGVVRGDAAHHLHTVLRVRKGESLALLDGAGHILPATVGDSSKHEVHVLPSGPVQTFPRTAPDVTIFQCVAKASHMEWLVEKAVELGAMELVPVLSRNCVSRPEAGSTVARWERIASAALEQCGGPWRMNIAPVHTWAQAIERVRTFPGAVLTAALPEGTPPIRTVLDEARNTPPGGSAATPLSEGGETGGKPRSYALFVGPEGDFADFELDELRDAGSRFIGLGSTVLRTDTATVAALACLRLLG